MRLAILFLYLLPSFAWSFNLDTTANEVLIQRNDLTVFKIPYYGINLEPSKIKVESKLGSVSYKQSKKNKHQSSLISACDTSVLLTDGDHEVNFKINSEGVLTIYTTSGHISFAIENQQNERFYGGGMQFSHSLLNGHKIVNICEENGIGRGDAPISKWSSLIGVKGEDYSSYYPLPFVVSNKNRGFFIKSSSLSSIEFHHDRTEISAIGKEMNIQLYQNKDMLSIIKEFNQENGRGIEVPDWALGNIIGVQGGTAEIKKKIAPLISRDIPIQGIWIQDWVGKRKTNIGSRLNWKWQLDSTYSGVFEFARQNNLKVLGYINPFFAETGEYTEIGLKKGYFIQENEEAKEFDFGGMKGYMLNIFDPNARDWMKYIIQINLIENGFDGWMADFAEWYPVDKAVDMESHNIYTHEWVKLNHEVLEESGKELYIFHRSGNIGTAQFTQATWCGDQMTNYGLNDGLGSVFNVMMSGGLSGLPPTHSDIGGYTSVKKPIIENVLRTEDLLKDWIKLEAFTPFFRSHEGLLPDQSLQIYSNQDVIEYYGKYAKIHYQLTDYFSDLIEEYKNSGTPVIKHPTLMNQEEIPYSFYVGDDIYIQLSFKTPALPIGFSFFARSEKNNHVYVAYRIGSSVEEMIKSDLK